MEDDAARVGKLRRQQAAAAGFGSFALRETDLPKILTEAARVCAECLDARFCKVCRYREAEGDLLIESGFGWKAGVVGNVVSRADESSPQGRAFITGSPSICNDLRKDNAFVLPPFYAAHGIISTIDVIIKGSDRPYGVLEIDSDEQHDYDEHDIDFLTGFANVLAEAVATSERTALMHFTVGKMQTLVRELAESEERFRTVVEAAPNALVMLDADGRIEMVNAQAERTFGYPRNELLGQLADKLVPKRIRSRYSADRSVPMDELQLQAMWSEPGLFGLHKDGQEFRVEVGVNAVEVDSHTRVLLTIVDVTERVLLEAQLRQAQKMEAIGRLTAGVAHDFNNLLQALTSGLQLLLDDVSDSPSALESGQIALRAARRGGELTHRLLAFSRQQTLTPHPVPVRQLFEDVADLITRTFGPNVDLAVLPTVKDLTVLADAAELEAAMINLAMNARDAMGGHGRLTISAHKTKSDTTMVVTPGTYIVISVSDTGTGMDDNTIAQACEPFFTTKGVGGSGLGLSMVQGFARQSGGDVRIISALGHGTRIEIWLPSVEPPAATPAIAPVQRALSGHILVVDDATDVLVTLAAFLRHAGYRVTSVATGDKALERLVAGDRFDAIVTDYAMPGLNGIDLLQQAREIDKTLPGLIITGFYSPALRELLDESFILPKPFSREQLIERIQTLVAGRRHDAVDALPGVTEGATPRP